MMEEIAARPIVITGSVRSGTTWVGRTIAQSPLVGYIHEPFNPWHNRERQGVCRAKIPYWRFYITEANEADYLEPVADMLAFRYNVLGALASVRSWKDIRRSVREYISFYRHRARGARPLVKDPFALFPAEWLADRFNAQIVVMIRHPAAVVSSIKRLGWGVPFHHLLAQPLLMRDHLEPFRTQIEAYAAERQDLVNQASLLWCLLYSVVAKYRKIHKDWIFLRHEDLARDPEKGFQDLCGRLGLPFSKEIQRAVREWTATSNPPEPGLNNPYRLRLNSRAAAVTWKKRLTPEEIERVRRQTWEVASRFYSEDEW